MKITFKNDIQKFAAHLQLEGNDRLIFSGPFGIGKTTFLKDFFGNNKEYEFFHLFPANYTVSENDNIFEYIKYDLLYQILDKIEIDKKTFTHFQTAWSYFIEKGDSLITPFFDGISIINKNVSSLGNTLLAFLKLRDDYLTYHNKFQKGDLPDIDIFRDKMESQMGSIFEHDLITQLIQYYVEIISNNDHPESSKKTVLIIDDLDRIDPDHFFRILNIFAAHIDQDFGDASLKNKFGFFQVIFVFDKDNARNIFQYRYGPRVDYDGYLNKFYSRTVYDFEPFSEISALIKDILSKVKIKDSDQKLLNLSNDTMLLTGFINHMLKNLLFRKKINLRNILKLVDKEYSYPVRRLNLPRGGRNYSSKNFLIIIFFDFLIELLGESKSLEVALRDVARYSDVQSDLHDKFYILMHLISLSHYESHYFSGKSEVTVIEIEQFKFRYRLINNEIVFAKLYDEKDQETNPQDLIETLMQININRLIFNAFIKCKELGIY